MSLLPDQGNPDEAPRTPAVEDDDEVTTDDERPARDDLLPDLAEKDEGDLAPDDA